MDNKIIAVIAVVIIVAAGAGAALVLMNNGGGEKDGLAIAGRVNTEGSGIILDTDEIATNYITTTTTEPGDGAKYIKNGDIYYVFNVTNWGGKIFCTPGTATIQHVQLGELATLMGLKYVSYTQGTSTSDDTLYYVAGVASFADFVNKLGSVEATGFIIWEAQYSVGLQLGYVGLALTNDLFDGHTCCIIGTTQSYAKSNTFAVFMNVYSNAVDRINAALADTSSDDYEKLLTIAKNRVAMPDSITTDAAKEAVIVSALEKVTYLYDDNGSGNLDALTTDIASLAESLYNTNQIQYSASDLGFSSYQAMAEKFVNNTGITSARNNTFTALTETATINVAVITGDIHQIAIWFALDEGMFEAAKLNVNISGQSNGPGVWTVLKNGEVDVGFLGAPPMTIRSMNAQAI